MPQPLHPFNDHLHLALLTLPAQVLIKPLHSSRSLLLLRLCRPLQLLRLLLWPSRRPTEIGIIAGTGGWTGEAASGSSSACVVDMLDVVALDGDGLVAAALDRQPDAAVLVDVGVAGVDPHFVAAFEVGVEGGGHGVGVVVGGRVVVQAAGGGPGAELGGDGVVGHDAADAEFGLVVGAGGCVAGTHDAGEDRGAVGLRSVDGVVLHNRFGAEVAQSCGGMRRGWGGLLGAIEVESAHETAELAGFDRRLVFGRVWSNGWQASRIFFSASSSSASFGNSSSRSRAISCRLSISPVSCAIRLRSERRSNCWRGVVHVIFEYALWHLFIIFTPRSRRQDRNAHLVPFCLRLGVVCGAAKVGDVFGSVLGRDTNMRGRSVLSRLLRESALQPPVAARLRRRSSRDGLTPVEVVFSMCGWGSGRGREKRREDCSRRAVGELAALDMVARCAQQFHPASCAASTMHRNWLPPSRRSVLYCTVLGLRRLSGSTPRTPTAGLAGLALRYSTVIAITQHNHTAAAALRVSDTTAILGHPPASSLTAPPSLHHEGSPSLPRCRIGPLRSRRCSIHETRCRLHSEHNTPIEDLQSYQIFLMYGGNTEDTWLQLATLVSQGDFSTGNQAQGTFDTGLAPSTKNAYFLRMVSVATEGGQVINFSNRFSISGMVGTIDATFTNAVPGGTDGPDGEDNAANNADSGAATSTMGTANPAHQDHQEAVLSPLSDELGKHCDDLVTESHYCDDRDGQSDIQCVEYGEHGCPGIQPEPGHGQIFCIRIIAFTAAFNEILGLDGSCTYSEVISMSVQLSHTGVVRGLPHCFETNSDFMPEYIPSDALVVRLLLAERGGLEVDRAYLYQVLRLPRCLPVLTSAHSKDLMCTTQSPEGRRLASRRYVKATRESGGTGRPAQRPSLRHGLCALLGHSGADLLSGMNRVGPASIPHGETWSTLTRENTQGNVERLQPRGRSMTDAHAGIERDGSRWPRQISGEALMLWGAGELETGGSVMAECIDPICNLEGRMRM
ncbi:hypothetical protein KC354_g2 [Hortaea werneckii]|nr:hypothetical protein KC354_g2 [Hortaea werneckii]